MADVSLNPVSLVVNGATVSSTNPLPVSAAGFASTTFASLGAATTAGKTYYVSNAGTKGSIWMADGTRWKPLNGSAVLATLDAASATVGNTDTVRFSYQMPAAFLQLTDRLRLYLSMNKSGTADAANLNVRLGTAGTTGDTAICTLTGVLASGNRAQGFIIDWRLESATTIQRLVKGNAATAPGYSGADNTATPAAVTVSNVSNSLFFSVSLNSAGTTDTVSLLDAQLYLVASAN